ncbi:hypothetical protein EDF24_3735 [Curtobacterium sp. PhB130]|nr:hypothetical protein EDF24_3735 [Curtobacterium sp. PhB130]TCK58266.1 hypothetical protein EDF27_3877 [Curtobacterium sp. PhB136]
MHGRQIRAALILALPSVRLRRYVAGAASTYAIAA